MRTKKQIIGAIGEDAACSFLQSRAYSILERNFSSKTGELDIIAVDIPRGNIVFVEVKTRSSVYFGYPYEFVDQKKRNRIIKTASYFLKTRNITWLQPRFDIIEIIKTDNGNYIRHLENVFYI